MRSREREVHEEKQLEEKSKLHVKPVKVEALKFWSDRLQHLQDEIDQARAQAKGRSLTPSAFVTFKCASCVCACALTLCHASPIAARCCDVAVVPAWHRDELGPGRPEARLSASFYFLIHQFSPLAPLSFPRA